jgi:hypothetical protein
MAICNNIISEINLRNRNKKLWGNFNEDHILVVDNIEKLKETRTEKSKLNIYDILSKTYFGKNNCDEKKLKNEIIDCPINGNPFEAKIILLYNNPALPNKTKDSKYVVTKNMKEDYYEKDQINIISDNLTLSPNAKLLFTSEKQNQNNAGKDWYDKIYNSLKKSIENNNSGNTYLFTDFEKYVCTLQWFPYPSLNFYDDFVSNGLNDKIKGLETHKFIVDLARHAIANDKTVIAMRSVVEWMNALSYDAILSENKCIEIKDHTLCKAEYNTKYENNFFISLDNLNPGPNPDKITKPMIGKLDFNNRLKK